MFSVVLTRAHLTVVKLLHAIRQAFSPGLHQRRNDGGLILAPELVLTEHKVAVLLRQPARLNHTDLCGCEGVGVWGGGGGG